MCRLIKYYKIGEPEKYFLVYDLSFCKTFVDPLNLFSLPDYDKYHLNKKGLFAEGGSLTLKNLEESYNWGIFPWFAKNSEEIHWYCPRRRYIIFPEKIHVGHSLRNILNKKRYKVTVNKAFKDVIHNCRFVDGRDDHKYAWLSEEIESLFNKLHLKGYAKSVEVWEDKEDGTEELVGGFYGFFHKGVFQGESMFSLRPSASQIALVELCKMGNIEGSKIKFIDTQFITQTFKRLGGEYIPYETYRKIMDSEDEEIK